MSGQIWNLVFEPFQQAYSSITSRDRGTGLGLAICLQLVQLMGGELGVESTPARVRRTSYELVARWPGDTIRMTSAARPRIPTGLTPDGGHQGFCGLTFWRGLVGVLHFASDG